MADRKLVEKLGRNAIQTIESEWNADTAAGRLVQFCVMQDFIKQDEVSAELISADRSLAMPESGPGSWAEVISERKMICKLL